MAESFKDIVTHEMRKEVLLNLLASGKRFDERAFDQYRNIEVEQGVIATAEGSALARIGKTQVLAGIKFDTATPFPDRPNEGVMITNAELLPLASPYFESGPPDENSIELARVVDRGIRSAEIIDTKKLFIEEGKVLSLYLDLYVIDQKGNMIDTAAFAAIAALKNTKMPKVENGKIIRGESTGSLNLSTLPIATTFIKVGDYWLADPSEEEESTIDTRLTITTTETHVCSMQKGQGKLSRQELFDNVESSFKLGAKIRKML